MSTHTIGTARRYRARVILVVLALAIAATVLTVQARSIWSATTISPAQPTVTQTDGHPYKDGWNRKDSHSAEVFRRLLRQIEAKKSG